jgi:hypothetical protein
MPAVLDAYCKWNARAPTGRVNRLVRKLSARLAGAGGGLGVARVKYLTQARARSTYGRTGFGKGYCWSWGTLRSAPPPACSLFLPPTSEPLAAPANEKQVKARPPTFAAFLGGRDEVQPHAARFLANAIRESLGFEGVPVRILFRYKTTEDGRRRTPHAAAGAGRWQHRRSGGAAAPAGGRFGDGPGRAPGRGRLSRARAPRICCRPRQRAGGARRAAAAELWRSLEHRRRATGRHAPAVRVAAVGQGRVARAVAAAARRPGRGTARRVMFRKPC